MTGPTETRVQNLLSARDTWVLHNASQRPSKQYKAEVQWCHCKSDMKSVQKYKRTKYLMRISFHNEKLKDGQFLWNGQMRFFMASAFQKWPIWQPWCVPTLAAAFADQANSLSRECSWCALFSHNSAACKAELWLGWAGWMLGRTGRLFDGVGRWHPVTIRRQWRNKGGKGGLLPLGAAFWGHQIEVSMLSNNYEMSNVNSCN